MLFSIPAIMTSRLGTTTTTTTAGGGTTDIQWATVSHTGTVAFTRDIINPAGGFIIYYSRQKMTSNGYVQAQVLSTDQTKLRLYDASGARFELALRADNNTSQSLHFDSGGGNDEADLTGPTYTDGLFWRFVIVGTAVKVQRSATEDGTYTDHYVFTTAASAANDFKMTIEVGASGTSNNITNTEFSGTVVNN